ncbi:hypothetical protein [Prescottella equi]|uniref:DUF3168 domain-containing protein n=1 Tax=Rhodococcus hoagii TaxID=43767 RepID=A0AAE5IUW4_RHOHA|nr:hypothetical protein [Prescottella equi]ORM31263.1 hypothetical protein A5N68_03400 [Prescottella equi]BDC71074.1 hypothetical protein KAREA_09890 [Prescottella equi]
MKALRKPRDAAVPIKDFLIGQLAATDHGATAALKLPTDWSPKSPPAVVVFDDGGPQRWPVSTKPQIRITVWAEGRGEAREIAGKCMGWLLALRVPGVKVSPGSALIDARDPKNGGMMASFTVNTTVRTTNL